MTETPIGDFIKRKSVEVGIPVDLGYESDSSTISVGGIGFDTDTLDITIETKTVGRTLKKWINSCLVCLGEKNL